MGTRLHFGLLDVGAATPRVFGGSGLALRTPSARIGWDEGYPDSLTVDSRGLIDDRAQVAITDALGRLVEATGAPKRGRLIVVDAPPQHIGLGVTTAVVLGALRLVNQVEGLGLSDDTLVALSGRGGTSGVGTGTFFEGGFVVDAGRARTDTEQMLPSGASAGLGVSLKATRLELPPEWNVRLCLPPGRRWSGDAEVDFFENNSPIPSDEILESLALTYHGIVPSILEGDLASLKSSLAILHRTGFKAREVESHGAGIRAFLEEINRSCAAAAGMSSMGPLVYLIGPPHVTGSTQVTALVNEYATDLGEHRPRVVGPSPATSAGS